MDENNQVLDVTYGNFSCRLEGFDDSVETMKVVVSFFHDLAGHDRFMDTEPLAPDMETLSRLTEEQTGQPVEAEGYDNKVSLRVRTEVVQDDVVADDTPDDMVDEVVAEEPVAEEAVEDDADAIADDLSSVADKLQRMRAAAARKIPSASDDYSEDLGEPEAAPAANPLSQRLNELVQRTTQADADADVSDEATVAEDTVEDITETDVTAQDDVSEDETLDAEDMNVFSDLKDDVAEEPAQTDTFVLNDPIDASADDPADMGDAEADMQSSETEMADAVQDEEEDAADTTDDDVAESVDEDAELDAFLAQEVTSEDEVEDDVVAMDEDAEQESETAGTDDIADVAKTDDAPLVLTTADEAGDAAEEEHDDYNDDDEFDLEAEVAKVEAEIAARQGTDLASRGLPRHVEDAMSRIMSQTDQHLNQPENRRHRDAFAQLKAAVAATEAARQLGDKGADKRDPDEVYKDDLGAHEAEDKGEAKGTPPLKLVKSQEVKPADDRRSEEAATPATAEEESSDAPSARLRQIATKKEAEVTEEGDDFAAFVASHGATDLADQLEAAGAYICFVDGDADFSRPQVMKLVQSASSAEISREDGLRSFGRLLRQARLVKLQNGRFQVSENTQFRPDGNQAAQG